MINLDLRVTQSQFILLGRLCIKYIYLCSMTLKSPLNAALDSWKHPATQDYRKPEIKLKIWNLQLFINLYSFIWYEKIR